LDYPSNKFHSSSHLLEQLHSPEHYTRLRTRRFAEPIFVSSLSPSTIIIIIIMSTTQIYTTENLEEPTPVQNAFTSHYDLDNPLAALQDYARNMHRHTQSQMERACRGSRRRTQGAPVIGMPGDGSQGSDHSSRTSSMASSMASGVASHAAINGYRRSS
jgi:hypothetical protein